MTKPRSEKSSAEERTDWAEERTDWAEDRTIQANERTFAGWMRTGLAAVGMGVALHAIFGKSEQTLLAKGVSILFVLIGITIFITALRASRRLVKRLNAHAVEPVSVRGMTLTAGTLSLASLAVAALLALL